MVLLEGQMKHQLGQYYHTGGLFFVGGEEYMTAASAPYINPRMMANLHPWAFNLVATYSQSSFLMDFGNDISFESPPLMTKALTL